MRLPLLLVGALACSPSAPGTLDLSVVDEYGVVTPARLELLREDGEAVVLPGALPVVEQCITPPPPGWAEFLIRDDHIDNPHTGTRQFYVDREVSAELPAGRYRLRAFKGIEYEVAERSFEIREGTRTEELVALERWSDLPSRGWWSADDHLHITRASPEDDAFIARWMRAEDLNVANLLQMGTQRQFSVAPQRAFGEEGEYRDGNTLVLSGQEHPRTHFLGHTITLGASAPIDLRDTYIVYRRFWEESRRLGGVSGFAHWGLGPAHDGFALDAPGGLLSFIEVLQFEFPFYDVWYEALDLGLRIAPTAGTDFPCGPWSVPGRERFFTRVEGPLTRESWLEGIRRGRTFVTNGPLLELRVAGADVGDEVRLRAPGRVAVEAVARFDPARDDLRQLELLRNGEVVAQERYESEPGVLRIAADVEVPGSAWIALRASGEKVGEAPLEPMGIPDWLIDIGKNIGSGAEIGPRRAFARAHDVRPAAAHTAPVWVTVSGAPPLAAGPRGGEVARAWRERLDDLEARLAPERVDEIPIWDWVPYSDGVSAEHLERNREALLAAIDAARRSLGGRAGEGP